MAYALYPLFLLAACGDADTAGDAHVATAAGERIECAVEGATAFARVCTAQRTAGAEGEVLIVRHPSGGFRRLLVARDGKGVVAADGAAPAAVSVIADDRIEVAVAGDRYRLPATIKGS